MSYADRDTSVDPKIVGGAISGIIALIFLFYVFIGFGASVSQEEYDSLRDGMSYSEVVQIVGGEGSLVMEMSTMGMRMRSYQWHGPGTSTVMLSFEGDRLAGKMIA